LWEDDEFYTLLYTLRLIHYIISLTIVAVSCFINTLLGFGGTTAVNSELDVSGATQYRNY